MPQRHGRRLSFVLLAGVMALALGGCQLPFGPQVKLSGTIYGEEVAARQAGRSVPVPLHATITCNSASGSSGSDGTFSLSVSQASTYSCTATAPDYSSVSASFSLKGSSITLTFGPKQAAKCVMDASTDAITCGVLPPAAATLRGTVTNAATDQALPHVKVQCWNSAMDVTAKTGASRVSTTTDSMGNYVFHNLAVDPWGCVAGTDQTLQNTTLKPSAATTLDIAACQSNCSNFKFHQGTVIHRLTAYLLFWLPSGYALEPDGNSSRFEHLMEQYFQDVGGTPFYNILSQYYDDQGGPVRNAVTLGGSYVDTQPYPQAGTVSDPLLDGDIVHEINRVLDAKNGAWITDDDHMVFVFTGYNVQECSGLTSVDGCTFTHNAEADFCAYHSNSFNNNLIYAYIPVVDGCLDTPTFLTPNHDQIADAIISIVSHEQFEAVSNPTLGGWFDGTSFEGEMGDKCVRIYGPIGDGGGNVALANGHHYLVQEEWSLRDQRCVLALS
jgi:Phosphate-induced protein 1 conserved region